MLTILAMNVTRFASAPEYFPPRHDGMRCVRLQGHEAGASDTVWIGMSQIEPGGGTSLDASPVEKLYVVLEGTVTVITDTAEVDLNCYDSCRLAPSEPRQLVNRTDRPTSILLVMPYVQSVLGGTKGPVVASSDYMRALPDLLGPYLGGRLLALGTDGFGRSETRKSLRRFFEVDAEHVAVAALSALAERGELDRAVVKKAIGIPILAKL